MPLLIASEIYGESTEDPPKNEPPLEARKVRFHWSAASNSGPESNTQSIEEKGEWIVRDPDGVDAAYMFRYDMVNGGRRARTYTENDIEHCVREFVRVNDKWPRIEIHCGKGCGFNVVFLRQTNWNPHSHVKILPGTPEPVTTIWGPHFDANRWVELSSTVLFAPSQDNDPLETASSHEESSEDSESSEESSGGRESSEDDTTNVPSTTYSQTETRIQRIQDRIIQTQGMMSRMYRRYRAQNARREEADMNESLARIAPRGLLWQP